MYSRILLLVSIIILTSVVAALYNNRILEKYIDGPKQLEPIRGCENEPLKIDCGDNYVLEKADIKYGRWEKADVCPVPTDLISKYKRIEESTFKDVQQPLPNEYLGKQVVEFVNSQTQKPLMVSDIIKTDPIAATATTRRGRGPVLPVFKHWEITATCKPISASVTGCEKDKIPTLSCPDGYIIPGARMKYGRWDNTVCLDDTVNEKTPEATDTIRIPDEYLGKQTIEWGDATMSSLSGGKDPIAGVSKHFEIVAECKKPKSN